MNGLEMKRLTNLMTSKEDAITSTYTIQLFNGEHLLKDFVQNTFRKRSSPLLKSFFLWKIMFLMGVLIAYGSSGKSFKKCFRG